MVHLRVGALALLVVLAFFGCQEPGTDPDAAVRERLSNKLWYPDTSVPNNLATTLYLYSDGSAAITGKRLYSWSYRGGVLTIDGPLGTETSSPAVTATTLVCTLNEGTCWFTTQP